MAISLLLPHITDAIGDLSISGVTIKKVNELNASYTLTNNVLYPQPEGFITGFRLEFVSFPRGEDAKVNVLYDLHYRFLSTQIGDLSNMATAYATMFEAVVALVSSLIEVHELYDGKVDMEVGAVTFGARADPVGNMFHGADITLNVMEMQNA